MEIFFEMCRSNVIKLESFVYRHLCVELAISFRRRMGVGFKFCVVLESNCRGRF